MEITKYKLILASNSPRRKELLAGINLPFEIHTLPDVDESYPGTLSHEEIPEFLARKKASGYLSELQDDALLITADTVVLLRDTILGKPADKPDAKRMLRELSGQTHRVITGVCLTAKGKQKSFSVVSKVTFDVLTDEEIDYYVEKYNPLDKAGAYGVQEWIGYVAVRHIDGSYYNIMGLPIQRVYRELREF
ncbi:MAG: Maf-like protein [Dysgonamonadaceae bacterium]|jgi:septum formation protein|nr:Maf-like protein [Dysgonamonadaceae bacterium]